MVHQLMFPRLAPKGRLGQNRRCRPTARPPPFEPSIATREVSRKPASLRKVVVSPFSPSSFFSDSAGAHFFFCSMAGATLGL